MKKMSLFCISLLALQIIIAQEHPSIHQIESEYYSKFNFENKTYAKPIVSRNETKCTLSKEVFGWFPYWIDTIYNSFDYDLLSEVSYFSYEVDTATGSYNSIHSWLTTNLVPLAISKNIRISLSVTLFHSHYKIFENPARKETLISTLIQLVQQRNANGVNIDFEGVSTNQSQNLTDFIIELCTRFHTELPDSRVSIAIPAVDWSNKFDVAAMNPYIDMFLIMAYEYYWSGSDYAGPNCPKNNGQIWYPYDATRSVNYYLSEGVSPEKLCLAVPYYGRKWKTEDSHPNSEALESGTALSYATIKRDYANYQLVWEDHSSTPYYTFQTNNNWYQCWFDNAQSLGLKYDMVKMKNIGGIGIWALGYDGYNGELWEQIREKFTDCGSLQIGGTFTDMGGPQGNYFNNENYLFTIAPRNIESLSIEFQTFQIENGYDTLFIYDGTTTENLIGKYTSSNSPQIINSQSKALTFHFISDGATTDLGWNANWLANSSSNIQISKFEGFSIHPNPFSDKLYIELNVSNQKQAEILIFDLKGNKCFSKNYSLKNGMNSLSIDFKIEKNTSQILLLTLKTDDYIITKKIIRTN